MCGQSRGVSRSVCPDKRCAVLLSEGFLEKTALMWKYNDERESKTFDVPFCHDVAYLAQLESVRKLQQGNGGESIHLIRAVV